jgi:hypothetical protein
MGAAASRLNSSLDERKQLLRSLFLAAPDSLQDRGDIIHALPTFYVMPVWKRSKVWSSYWVLESV